MPLIALSGTVVAFGWALYGYSKRIDCHSTGCHHGACEPRKKTANLILKIATVLFLANTAVFLVFHKGMQIAVPTAAEADVQHSHETN